MPYADPVVAKAAAKTRNQRYYARHKTKVDERNVAWGKANPEKRRAISRRYLAAHPVRYLLTLARNRAKRKGVPFAITEADVTLPTHCPVLGIKLDYGFDKGGTHRPNSPSLDRIVPSRGYVPGNVAVISIRANIIKNNATAEELQAVADYVRLFT